MAQKKNPASPSILSQVKTSEFSWFKQAFYSIGKHFLLLYTLQSRCWESESKFINGGIRCCGVCNRGREMFDLRNKECVHTIVNLGIA